MQSFTPEAIVRRSSNLIKYFPEGLEECLGNEFVQFPELLKADLAPHIVSFLKLKGIKNEIRSTVGQDRLNNLTLMSIEYGLLLDREMDISSIISRIAHAKSRKCNC